MLDKGYSYTTAPLIAISPPPSGETATDVAIMKPMVMEHFMLKKLK